MGVDAVTGEKRDWRVISGMQHVMMMMMMMMGR